MDDPQEQEQEQEQETPPQTPPRGGGRRGYPEDFEAFWAAYPHGEGDPKAPAFDRWKRATRDGHDPDQITAAARRYAASLKKPDAPKPAHARTWLAQRRWEVWGPPATGAGEAAAPFEFRIGVTPGSTPADFGGILAEWVTPPLRKQFDDARLNAWLGKTRACFHESDDPDDRGVLVWIEAETDFIADKVRQEFGAELNRIFDLAMAGSDVEFLIIGPTDIPPHLRRAKPKLQAVG